MKLHRPKSRGGWLAAGFTVPATLLLMVTFPPLPALAEEEMPEPATAQADQDGSVSPAKDDDYAILDLESLLAEKVVESASRRSESIYNAPVSITVIKADDIASTGAQNLAEVLIRVPGLHQLHMSANGYSIGMRGYSDVLNDKVLILVDGRAVTDFLSIQQPWGALAIHPEDVQKIEVIRGPGSTFYGTNAVSGVINIISKRATDHPGVEASAWGTLNGLRGQNSSIQGDYWLQSGGGAHLGYNWANQAETTGMRLVLNMNHLPEWPTEITLRDSGSFNYSAQGSVNYRPDEEFKLFLSVQHLMAEHVVMLGQRNPLSYKTSEQSLTLGLEKKSFIFDSLTLKANLDAARRTLKAFSSDEFTGSEGEASSTKVEMYSAHGLVLIDLSLLDGHNVTSLGGEVTFNQVGNYFGATPGYLFTGLILNNETRFFDDHALILNLGGRLEQIVVYADELGQIIYRHLSPRLALNYRLAEKQSIRLVAASAFRTPSPSEATSPVAVQIYDLPVPKNLFRSPNPRLRPEQVYSLELGYRGQLFEALDLDLALFGQRVSKTIGESGENITPNSPVNLPTYYQAGVELGSSIHYSQHLSAYLNYTFVYSMNDNFQPANRDWPKHIWSVGTEVRLPWRSRLNIDAHLLFDYKVRVSSAYNLGQPSQYFRFEDIQAADRARIDLRLGRFFLARQAELFLAVRNALGFFREQQGLLSYPDPTMQSIGGTVMLGLVVRGL